MALALVGLLPWPQFLRAGLSLSFSVAICIISCESDKALCQIHSAEPCLVCVTSTYLPVYRGGCRSPEMGLCKDV